MSYRSFSALLLAMPAAFAASQAMAHATFANGAVNPESYVSAVLQVPHGCDGKATTEVQVKLPEGFIAAKPQPKPGWELDLTKGKYEKSYDNHGKPLTEGLVEVRWKNGNLPDDFYDTFVIYGKVSGVQPGTALPFKVVQLCGADAKVAWDEIAPAGTNPHSLKSPAPLLMVAQAAPAEEHDHTAMANHDMAGMEASTAPAEAGSGKLGTLALSGGYVKAMLPGQPVGGGYVTIENKGEGQDRLLSLSSPAAGRVELHEMAMQDNVMKMRKVDGGLPIAAGGKLEMKPGGYHLMFMEVRQPFKAGDKVPVQLTFEKAGTVTLDLPVTGK
ncbi:copper chaperone PCu(A)C [Rhizobium paknamense]|uniref:Uncharacterized protein YcnI/copper(I)-binding protein n=1 Tax=Rhizobium paknamense TaxID=1206817 RepID=A0ABU0ICX4_9HYPH|nr:uncharacterized protein YcnI/copper(I)-binding protein [Rhizobium paknamense]